MMWTSDMEGHSHSQEPPTKDPPYSSGLFFSSEIFTSSGVFPLSSTPPPGVRGSVGLAFDGNFAARWLSGQALVYVCIGAVGLVGNGLVVWVMTNFPPLQKSVTNMFILNQSVIDLMTSSMLVVHAGVRFYESGLDGVGGLLYCSFWVAKPFVWSLFLCSTCNLVAITLERYVGVVHPLHHMAYFTRRKARVIIAVVWLSGPVFNFSYMFPTTVLTEDGICLPYSRWLHENWRVFIGVSNSLLYLFLPVVIMVVAYTRMALALRRSTASTATNESSSQGGATASDPRLKKMEKVRVNVIKTLVLVCVAYVLCWSWNQVWYLLLNLGLPLDLNSTFYHFTVFASATNCCVNPFVYLIKYELFRRGLRSLCCCCRRRAGADDDNDSSDAQLSGSKITIATVM